MHEDSFRVKSDSPTFAARRSNMLRFAWTLVSALFLFTTENVWLDPWLKSKYTKFPSLVPDPFSAVWLLDFAFCVIALVLLVVCTVFVVRSRSLRASSKATLVILTCVLPILVLDWYRVTNGLPPILPLGRYHRPHSVKLSWNSSTSNVAGYNVYRSLSPGGDYYRLNSSIVHGATFSDTSVENGAIYCYTTRAVDVAGRESMNSNEVCVRIPR